MELTIPRMWHSVLIEAHLEVKGESVKAITAVYGLFLIDNMT